MGIIDETQKAAATPPGAAAVPAGPVPSSPGPQAVASDERETMDNLGLGEQATEEEQAIYDAMIMAATEIMYADESHGEIVKMLKDGAQIPEQTIAQLVNTIIVQIDQAGGGKIPEDMILTPVPEIVEQMLGLARDAGAFEQVDERLVQRSAQAALLQVGDTYDVSPEEIQAYIDQLSDEQIQQIVSEQSAYTNEPVQQPAPAQPGVPA